MLDWKNLLALVLGVLLPTLYSLITGALPGLPLDQETFVSIVLWVVGLLIGGWNANAYFMKKKLRAGKDVL